MLGTVMQCDFTFHKLTSRLYAKDPKTFECNKVCGWLRLIQEMRAYPFKWSKPTNSGLKVKCKPIQSKEQFDAAIKELSDYIEWVNKAYDFDLQLTKS